MLGADHSIDMSHMQDFDKIFYVHLINAKVLHCLSIFQKIVKTTIGKNFYNNFSDPCTEI